MSCYAPLMIHPSESIRIKIGIGLIVILSVVMLAESVQQSLTITRLEIDNSLLSYRLHSAELRQAMMRPVVTPSRLNHP
jgi:hypothetical protein